MKRGLLTAAKVIGLIWFIILGAISVGLVAEREIGACIVPAILALLGLTLFIWAQRKIRKLYGDIIAIAKNNKQEHKAQAKKDKLQLREKSRRTIKVKHTAGLPLAQNTPCAIEFETDRLVITGGGNTFNVAYSKITDMQVITETQIQKHYVSSVGGAVVGGALFGVLGAAIGGRAKQKTSSSNSYYFIVTYKNEEQISNCAFEVVSGSAGRLIAETRPSLAKETSAVNL